MDAIAIEDQARAWLDYIGKGGRLTFAEWSRTKYFSIAERNRIRTAVQRLQGVPPEEP